MQLRDPVRIRVFWQQIGWSERWSRRWRLHRPEALLENAPAEAGSAGGVQQALPHRFRLVYVDKGGLGFAFTDEDDELTREDPAVWALLFEIGTKVLVGRSYLNWCANELSSVAFVSWCAVTLTLADPGPLFEAAGPLPTLCPALRRLDGTGEAWLMPWQSESALPSRDLRRELESSGVFRTRNRTSRDKSGMPARC